MTRVSDASGGPREVWSRRGKIWIRALTCGKGLLMSQSLAAADFSGGMMTNPMEESDAGFRHLADAIPVGLLLVDADRIIRYANRQWYNHCGTLYLDARTDWTHFLHPDDSRAILAHWPRATETGQAFSLDVRLQAALSDSLHWFHAHIQPLRSGGGPRSWLITFTDIQPTRQAQQEAADARRQMIEHNEARERLLSSISHELRTPLNAILGWIELLQMRMLDPAEVKTAVSSIEQNARAQAKLVDDILDVSRAVNHKLRINPTMLDARDPVWAAIETIRPSADAEDITLTLQMPDHPVCVRADNGRLQQIVWNILANAVKFSDPGGRIEVQVQTDLALARISVSDQGRGIAPEMLQSIFNHLVQVDHASARSQQGLGLGLAIVKHLVELHGGEVVAQSPGLGRGATFTVSLPLQPSSHLANEVHRPPAGLTPGILRDVKVLVIDDEPFSRQLVATTLRKVAATTATAGSAGEAFAQLATFRPHVILCDIGMPLEDGYAFISRLRGMEDPAIAQTPTVALTGYASNDDRIRALQAGFNQHLSKPIGPVALVEVVSKLRPGATP